MFLLSIYVSSVVRTLAVFNLLFLKRGDEIYQGGYSGLYLLERKLF